MSSWPSKDPNEVLDYVVHWSDVDPTESRLETGETLITSTFTVATGDANIDSSTFTAAGDATVWLSAGTAGTVCEILNRVTTSAGRTYDKTVTLRIRDH